MKGLSRLWLVKLMFLILGAMPCWAQETQSLDQIVAIVNNGVITERDLNQQINQTRQQLQHQQVELPAAAVLRSQVLQRMIDIELQMQLVKDNGLEASSEEVDAAINHVARNNRMSLSQLKAVVSSQGKTWPEYRKNIHQELLLSKMQQEAVGTVSVTEDQVSQAMQSAPIKQRLSYHVRDILLPLTEAPTSEELADRQALAKKLMTSLKQGMAFDKAAISYSGGEVALKGGDLGFRSLASLPTLFVEYVPTMKAGEVRGPIRAPNGYHVIKLEAVRSDNKAHWTTLTHVKQILLKAKPHQDRADLNKQVRQIQALLAKGVSFGSLAAKYSEDAMSRNKGGDMGWLHPGQTLPEFESAYLKLASGQTGKPVVTSYGVHLIQVVARKKIDDSMSYQREQVRQALYERKFQEGIAHWLQQLRGNAYIKVIT